MYHLLWIQAPLVTMTIQLQKSSQTRRNKKQQSIWMLQDNIFVRTIIMGHKIQSSRKSGVHSSIHPKKGCQRILFIYCMEKYYVRFEVLRSFMLAIICVNSDLWCRIPKRLTLYCRFLAVSNDKTQTSCVL